MQNKSSGAGSNPAPTTKQVHRSGQVKRYGKLKRDRNRLFEAFTCVAPHRQTKRDFAGVQSKPAFLNLTNLNPMEQPQQTICIVLAVLAGIVYLLTYKKAVRLIMKSIRDKGIKFNFD